jgi:lipoprotein-anchoring transpeptidase ErfK/SrfK
LNLLSGGEVMSTRFKAIVAGVTLLFLSAWHANLLPQPASARSRSGSDLLTEANDRSPLKLPLIRPKIVVKKSRRQLLLFSEDKLVRTYRIGLGLSPVGDKVRAGDRRTPEGDFYIFTRNDKSAFYLSLGISYPNAPAARRGLRNHLIKKIQYDAIMGALRAQRGPPQDTLLGGDIYIHGSGAGSDWTWGCVALENEDIRELFNAVNVGTPVRIEP